MKTRSIALLAATLLLAGSAAAQQVKLDGRPILSAAAKLKPGQYLWEPQLAPEGPGLVIVNLDTQKLNLFRGGTPIAASSVSSGAKGHETPTGVFTILQKAKEHYSSTYNNAPMPNMQRLTWKGIALHAGNLPGYPASHGCIRLPHAFSALLFGATKLGMTVVITSHPEIPYAADDPDIASEVIGNGRPRPLANASFQWHPQRSNAGLVSVIISKSDEEAIVMQGGARIGSAPVHVRGPLRGAMAYVLESRNAEGVNWLKVQLSGPSKAMKVDPDEGEHFDAPSKFRQDLATLLRPGSVILVTPATLKSGGLGTHETVIVS